VYGSQRLCPESHGIGESFDCCVEPFVPGSLDVAAIEYLDHTFRMYDKGFSEGETAGCVAGGLSVLWGGKSSSEPYTRHRNGTDPYK
jgi:hypothetical protein